MTTPAATAGPSGAATVPFDFEAATMAGTPPPLPSDWAELTASGGAIQKACQEIEGSLGKHEAQVRGWFTESINALFLDKTSETVNQLQELERKLSELYAHMVKLKGKDSLVCALTTAHPLFVEGMERGITMSSSYQKLEDARKRFFDLIGNIIRRKKEVTLLVKHYKEQLPHPQ